MTTENGVPTVNINKYTNRPELQFPVTVTAIGRPRLSRDKTKTFYTVDIILADTDIKTGEPRRNADQSIITKTAMAIVSEKQITDIATGISYWATFRPLEENPNVYGYSIGGLRCKRMVEEFSDADAQAMESALMAEVAKAEQGIANRNVATPKVDVAQ